MTVGANANETTLPEVTTPTKGDGARAGAAARSIDDPMIDILTRELETAIGMLTTDASIAAEIGSGTTTGIGTVREIIGLKMIVEERETTAGGTDANPGRLKEGILPY